MTITPREARSLAADWHGGQWSPLYALASTGTVTDRAADEVAADIAWCEANRDAPEASDLPALVDLLAYVLVHQGDAERAAAAKLRALVGAEEGHPWPGYAWPGAYPIVYVTDDGDTLCATCMTTQRESVHFTGDADGWRVDGAYAEEGGAECDVVCCHCAMVIAEGHLNDEGGE